MTVCDQYPSFAFISEEFSHSLSQCPMMFHLNLSSSCSSYYSWTAAWSILTYDIDIDVTSSPHIRGMVQPAAYFNPTTPEFLKWTFQSMRSDTFFLQIHYENMPIQIYRKFHLQKLNFIQINNSDIFHISDQNIVCGYSLEPPRLGGSNEYPQSMSFSIIRKIMYTPVNPSFTI